MSEIRKLAEEVSAREGCYLYDVEFVGAGNGRVLRVTIDKDAEGGVSVEDCTNISRAINLRLDVEDVIPGGQYNLEVSSPGLERPLKEPRHYKGALSKLINVKSFAPLAQFNESLPPELLKAKQIQGPLKSFDDKGLYVEYVPPAKPSQAKNGVSKLLNDSAGEAGTNTVYVPFESVTKAHVVFEFTAPQKPGHGPKKPHPKSLANNGAKAGQEK